MTRTKTRIEPDWLIETNAALSAAVADVDPAEWVYGYPMTH
ncbi:hypothetical protein [Nocardia sp. NPDC003183]